MVKNTILLLFMLASISAFSQNRDTICGFDAYIAHSDVEAVEAMLQKASQKYGLSSQAKTNHDSIKVVPIVVHVIHLGGTENISEAQVLSQIQVLNEDFGKLEGTNGDGDGVDTRVRYCLANIDPAGNCTNGIVRLNTPLSNHQTYQRSLLKELSFWDNTRYLNIYVVKTINGNVGGYSSFPGGPADEDGIVVRHSLFGNTGTATGSGRTSSHELGHWLGLYHTFNNGCGTDPCTDGDYICDTPPQAAPSFSCTTLNTCSNDVPNLPDLKENYMNYTPDNCQDMFTQGQHDRIQATLDTLRPYIWTPENLVSTGCDSNYVAPELCAVVADLVTLTPEVCTGNSIYFIDKSLNGATSWTWSFPGGVPSSSTQQNPTVTYSDVGTYAVTLAVANANSSDLVEMTDLITVSIPGTGDPLYFSEDFDLGIYPPSTIEINNLDGGITWVLDSVASVSGQYSIKIDNLINTNYGSSDEMILPYLDFTTADPDSAVYMSFHWAYAKSDPSFSDELLVLISTDCGVNYDQVFYRTHSTLTSAPLHTTPFIPDSSQWRSAHIPLDLYQSESFVQLKFVNVTDGGNNLYIDNIYVGDGSGGFITGLVHPSAATKLTLYPNPSSGSATLQFSLTSQSAVGIEVYSILGQRIESMDKKVLAPGPHRMLLNTSTYPAGTYIIKVRANNTQAHIKLLVE